MAIYLDAVDSNVAAISQIEATEQVEKRAFAAARGAAESDRLTFCSFKVCAFQYGDRAIVITLPHVFGMKHNSSRLIERYPWETHSKRSASTARMRMA